MESRWNSIDKVENFIALAFFRSPRYHVIQYIVGIVVLGALGESIHSLLTFLSIHWKFPEQEDSYGTQAAIAVVLALFFALIWLFSVDRRAVLARVKSLARGIPFFSAR